MAAAARATASFLAAVPAARGGGSCLYGGSAASGGAGSRVGGGDGHGRGADHPTGHGQAAPARPPGGRAARRRPAAGRREQRRPHGNGSDDDGPVSAGGRALGGGPFVEAYTPVPERVVLKGGITDLMQGDSPSDDKLAGRGASPTAAPAVPAKGCAGDGGVAGPPAAAGPTLAGGPTASAACVAGSDRQRMHWAGKGHSRTGGHCKVANDARFRHDERGGALLVWRDARERDTCDERAPEG